MKNFFSVTIILSFILLFVSGCKKNASKKTFIEINPTRGSIGIEFRISGSVQPRNRLEIKPQIAGRLEEMLVVEGTKVKKGDIIAWMSSTDRAAILDIVKTQTLQSDTDWNEVYKPTPIISPIDGFIIARNKEPGQTVALNDIIFVLADKLIIKANVDETDLRHVTLGQEVKIFLDAYSDKRFKGSVEHIAYESKEISNVTVYEIKILPKSVPKIFRTGMTATITVEANKKDDVLLLPSDAIIKKDRKSFVNIKTSGKNNFSNKNRKKNGTIQLHEVVTGIDTGQKIEIVSGITEEDIVLISDTGKVSRTPGGRMAAGIPGISSTRRR